MSADDKSWWNNFYLRMWVTTRDYYTSSVRCSSTFGLEINRIPTDSRDTHFGSPTYLGSSNTGPPFFRKAIIPPVWHTSNIYEKVSCRAYFWITLHVLNGKELDDGWWEEWVGNVISLRIWEWEESASLKFKSALLPCRRLISELTPEILYKIPNR